MMYMYAQLCIVVFCIHCKTNVIAPLKLKRFRLNIFRLLIASRLIMCIVCNATYYLYLKDKKAEKHSERKLYLVYVIKVV